MLPYVGFSIFLIGYVVLSIAWFFAGHLLGFFALGRIVKRGTLKTAAKAAGITVGAWALFSATGIGFVYLFESSLSGEAIGIALMLLGFFIGAIVYFSILSILSMRMYALDTKYAILAALAIGFSYLAITMVLGMIIQFLFMMVFLFSFSV